MRRTRWRRLIRARLGRRIRVRRSRWKTGGFLGIKSSSACHFASSITKVSSGVSSFSVPGLQMQGHEYT